MDTILSLALIKNCSFFISAFASIWALISKTTYEDDERRKRLTGAGRVSIGITVVSAIFSLLAFGFEGMAKRDEAAVRQAEKMAEQQQQRDIEIARRQEEREKANREWRYRQEQQARSDRLAQRQELAILSAASDQQKRDSDMQRAIAEGNAASLSRMEAALFELKRLGLPIEPIQMSLRLQGKGSRLTKSDYWRRLQLARSNGQGTDVMLTNDDDLFPKEADGKMWGMLSDLLVVCEIFLNDNDAKDYVRALQRGEDTISRHNLFFFVKPKVQGVYVDTVQQTLDYSFSTTQVEKRFMGRTDNVQSVIDLENAVLVMHFGREVEKMKLRPGEDGWDTLGLTSFHLTFGQRTIVLTKSRFQKLSTPTGAPIIIVDRIGMTSPQVSVREASR
jgi:hypothetical protein